MIKINNLKFSYSMMGKSIFEGLNIELTEGHIYGLLGLNGSGKSTLLKLISGMLLPKSGEVNTLGYEASERIPSMMSQIYYLPEEIYSPARTMASYAKVIAPFYPNFDNDHLQQYMAEFELSTDQKLSSMSLGQKKKAAIALALACNTKLLIMDEPTNGLDIPSKSQFRKVLSSIANDERMIIISTHQVRDLESLIDSIVILKESRIIVNSTIEAIDNCLTFRKLYEGEEAIYEESTVIGRYGVLENRDGEESRLDIELLFNAAIAQPNKIESILKL